MIIQNRQNKWLIIAMFLLLLCPLYSSAQQSFQWQKAQKGEGINALLLRNHLSPSKYYSIFIKLNHDRLSLKNQLLAGKKYRIPLLFPIHNNPLFGKKYSNVTQIDNSLNGCIFYLVGGHGGPDPGATVKISGHIITEDEYSYDIMLRLARELITHGAKVKIIIQDPNDGIRDKRFLSHDKDEFCYPHQTIPSKQTPRLHQRAAIVNILSRKHKPTTHQRLIMFHLDSRARKNQTDVFFYYHESSRKGKNLALALQSTFKKKYAHYQPNRKYTGKIKNRRLYMLTTTTPPSTLIEMGNIHNLRDQKRFLQPQNREVLAQWICQGLILDYNNNRKK